MESKALFPYFHQSQGESCPRQSEEMFLWYAALHEPTVTCSGILHNLQKLPVLIRALLFPREPRCSGIAIPRPFPIASCPASSPFRSVTFSVRPLPGDPFFALLCYCPSRAPVAVCRPHAPCAGLSVGFMRVGTWVCLCSLPRIGPVHRQALSKPWMGRWMMGGEWMGRWIGGWMDEWMDGGQMGG